MALQQTLEELVPALPLVKVNFLLCTKQFTLGES